MRFIHRFLVPALFSVTLIACSEGAPNALTEPESVAFSRLVATPEEADKNGDGFVCRKDDGTGFMDARTKGPLACRDGFSVVVS
jgi:hypothetical protein